MVDKSKFCGDVVGKPKKGLPPLVVTDDMVYSNLTFHYFSTRTEMDSFVELRQATTEDKVYPTAREDGTFSVCVFVK